MVEHHETRQCDVSSGSSGTEDGANYPRRMKQETATEQPGPASAVSPSAANSGKERRRSARLRCSGSAEFRTEGSDVRMWGTLSDVSLHGCYVEMNNTFPVDTRVNLILETMGVRTHMQAVVRVSYPFLGMGLCFSEIDPGQQAQLEQMLAALSGSSTAPSPESSLTPAPTPMRSLADVDPVAMLDRLTEFFRNNALLSRKEFYDFARRSSPLTPQQE
jgi:hypothetical protein